MMSAPSKPAKREIERVRAGSKGRQKAGAVRFQKTRSAERTQPNFSGKNLALGLLLAGLTLALYSPVRSQPFLDNYDDDMYVMRNAHVQAGLTWETIAWAFTSTEQANWHPVTWLSHALDCQLFGMNAGAHHVVNAILHAMNAMLLFLLLVHATHARWRSWMVAALFALHPLNVESVAWIAERKNVLSTLFFLLALGAYGWYTLAPNRRRYAVVAGLFVLGLAAKPMVITLPFVFLLMDMWPLQRITGLGPHAENSDVPQRSVPALIVEKLPWLALSAASAVITLIAQHSGHAVRSLQDYPLWVRVENAAYAYAMYVWKAFWPSDLALLYPHPGDTLSPLKVTAAVVFLVAVSGLVWKMRDRRYPVTGWLWFLGTLVPVIGLIQVGYQAMADRYAYIPLIGIFVMIVWGLGDAGDRWRIGVRWMATAAGLALLCLSLVTWRQIAYWNTNYDVWAHTVVVTSNNFFAERNLGAALIQLNRDEEALGHFQNALRMNPADPFSQLNIAATLQKENRFAEAIAGYGVVIDEASNPTYLAGAYNNRGTIYSRLGQYAKAREDYRHAQQINPADSAAFIHDFYRTAAVYPSAQTYLWLGILLEEGGRWDDARSAYQRALEFDPELQEAKRALGEHVR